MDEFLEAAVAEAEAGLAEGGIPIGSVLVQSGRPNRQEFSPRAEPRQRLCQLPGNVRAQCSPCRVAAYALR